MMEHRIVRQRRRAPCCDEHKDDWAVCSCGWSANGRLVDLGSSILDHRISIIEEALGIKVTFA